CTSTQPEAVLIRNGDGTLVSRNRAVIKCDTGTERPVIIHIVGCTQRNTVSVVETFVLIEQRLAVVASCFQLLELAPAGVCQAIVNGPLWRDAVVTGDFPHFWQMQ